MSHLVGTSESENPIARRGVYGDQPYSDPSEHRRTRGHPSASSDQLHKSQAAGIDGNLSCTSGGSAWNKTDDEGRLNKYKKQARGFENFENNRPMTDHRGTAAIVADRCMPETDNRPTLIRERRNDRETLNFGHPPPLQRRQEQNQIGGVVNIRPQSGGGGQIGGVVNNRPLGGVGGGDQHPQEPGRGCGGRWRARCTKIWTYVRHAYAVVVTLLVLTGLVSIVVWLADVNKQNTEPQVFYASLFEVLPLEEKLHPLTKGGADVKVNLTGRVHPKFQDDNFYLSLYHGSCDLRPNQTFIGSGRAEDYQIFGNYQFVSHHVFMFGSSAELNISFSLSNNTFINAVSFIVYFFKSYEELLACKNSQPDETDEHCPCYFYIPNPGKPSFSYGNGSYADYIICQRPDEKVREKPFVGHHYFLTKFLCEYSPACNSPSSYYDLFVDFTFTYNTTDVYDPFAKIFNEQHCNSLDDTNSKIIEYGCELAYGSFFNSGRSLCTYLTLATSFNAPEYDSRFRDVFPVTMTERNRNDVVPFIAGVMALAIVLLPLIYCVPCRVWTAVRTKCANRDPYHYQELH